MVLGAPSAFAFSLLPLRGLLPHVDGTLPLFASTADREPDDDDLTLSAALSTSALFAVAEAEAAAGGAEGAGVAGVAEDAGVAKADPGAGTRAPDAPSSIPNALSNLAGQGCLRSSGFSR